MTLFLGLLVLTLAVPVLAWKSVAAPNAEDAAKGQDAAKAELALVGEGGGEGEKGADEALARVAVHGAALLYQ